MTDPAQKQRTIRGAVLLLLCLLLLTFVVRSVRLGERELWLDEAYSVWLTDAESDGILADLEQSQTPPLFYVLLRGWRRLVPDGEAGLRLLSVLFGLGQVLCVFCLGWELASLRVGGWAGFLSAIHPLHIYYTRELRMYALLPLFALLCLWAVRRYARRGGKRHLGIYGLSLLAGCLTHNYFLFLVPAGPVAVFFGVTGKGRSRAIRGVVGATVVSGLVYLLLWGPTLVRQVTTPLPPWIGREFDALGPLGAVGWTMLVFAFGPYPRHLHEPGRTALLVGEWGHWILAGIGALLFLFLFARGLWALGRRDGTLFGVFVVSPAFFGIGYSVLARPIYLVGRYEALILPLFLLVVARGLVTLRPQLRWVGGAVAFACALPVILSFYLLIAPGTYRPVAQTLLEKSRPDREVVVSTGLGFAPLWYQLRSHGSSIPIVTYPAEQKEHVGWYDPRGYRSRAEQLEADLLDLAERPEPLWLQLEPPPGRLYHPEEFALALALERGFRTVLLEYPIRVSVPILTREGRRGLPSAFPYSPGGQVLVYVPAAD